MLKELQREFFLRMEYCTFQYTYWQSQIKDIDVKFCAPSWELSPEDENKRNCLINQLYKTEDASAEFYTRFKRDEDVLKKRYIPNAEVQKIRKIRDKLTASVDLFGDKNSLCKINNLMREGFFYEDCKIFYNKYRNGEKDYDLFISQAPVISLISNLLLAKAKVKLMQVGGCKKPVSGLIRLAMEVACFRSDHERACDKYWAGDKEGVLSLFIKNEQLIMRMFDEYTRCVK